MAQLRNVPVAGNWNDTIAKYMQPDAMTGTGSIPILESRLRTPYGTLPQGAARGSGGFGGMGDAAIGYANTLTPEQQSILGGGSSLISKLFGQNAGGYSAFNALTPQQAQSFYQQYFNPAEQAKFQNETLPSVREAFVGPGTYWSGARAQAEANAQQNFANAQNQNVGNLYLQSQQQALQSLLPFALGLGNMETGTTYGRGAQGGGGGQNAGMNELIKMLLGNFQKKQGAQQGQQQGQGGVPFFPNENDFGQTDPYGLGDILMNKMRSGQIDQMSPNFQNQGLPSWLTVGTGLGGNNSLTSLSRPQGMDRPDFGYGLPSELLSDLGY